MKRVYLGFLIIMFILAGCQSGSVHPLFTPSSAEAVKSYASFDEYVNKTKSFVDSNRYYLTKEREKELQANLPFEIKPENQSPTRKGILLIHGLGDSPWSFIDIGKSLAGKGFLVRTVLLPGHGTRPADMLNVSYNDWEATVSKQVELLKEVVDEVYLGGFSTGGNLAYLHAAKDESIKGLLLFSPAFKSDEPLAYLTPLLSLFKEWLLTSDPASVTNYTRYTAMPTNGFAQYYRTSEKSLQGLEKNNFDRPVFIALSQHDSVLDYEGIKNLYQEKFTHPDNLMMLFSESGAESEDRVRAVKSYVPELRISNFSHMGILFSPNNPYYGINGTERICRNGQESSEAEKYCKQGNPVWYSAWGYQEAGKVHARLTFNPYFDQMMNEIYTVFDL